MPLRAFPPPPTRPTPFISFPHLCPPSKIYSWLLEEEKPKNRSIDRRSRAHKNRKYFCGFDPLSNISVLSLFLLQAPSLRRYRRRRRIPRPQKETLRKTEATAATSAAAAATLLMPRLLLLLRRPTTTLTTSAATAPPSPRSR